MILNNHTIYVYLYHRSSLLAPHIPLFLLIPA